jgi:drug/metabolite transporter (DMT)-like permease
MATPPESRKVLSTSEGVNREAFSPLDWTLFVSVALIWGSSFILMDIGLEAFEPGLITLLRVGLGAAALWLVPAARSTRVDQADWPRLIALSVIWVAIPFTLFPVTQQYINSAIAGMLNGAVPIFAAVVAVVMLRRLLRAVTIA